jgi:dCMP deaminase
MLLKNSAVSKVIVAYVPALHAGYISFLNLYPGVPVFILGKSFIDAYPRLNRDIRALEPVQAASALEALGYKVHVIEMDNLESLEEFKVIILPDEDVSRDFAKKYLKDEDNKDIELQNIFLRWDGVFSNKENEVSPERIVSVDMLDKEFMELAVTEGKRSADWWRQIGAVLVQDKKVLYKTHIRYFPSDLALDVFGTPRTTVDFGERPDLYISMHAEADAIAQAAKAGVPLAGASLYSSTFPCINCAFLIARSGISKVYYSQGYSRLDAEGIFKQAGIEIILVQF